MVAISCGRTAQTVPGRPSARSHDRGPGADRACAARACARAHTAVAAVPCARANVHILPNRPQIGFVETEEAQERKSGAEAWSLRLHDKVVSTGRLTTFFLKSEEREGQRAGRRRAQAQPQRAHGPAAAVRAQHPPRLAPLTPGRGPCPQVEMPYEAFAARFGEGVPFHRIACFKQNGAVVWCARGGGGGGWVWGGGETAMHVPLLLASRGASAFNTPACGLDPRPESLPIRLPPLPQGV